MQDSEFDREILVGTCARIGGALMQYGSIIGTIMLYNENPLFLIGGAAGYIIGEIGIATGERLTTNALIRKRESELEKQITP